VQESLSPLCQQQKPPTPVGAVQTSVVYVNGILWIPLKEGFVVKGGPKTG